MKFFVALLALSLINPGQNIQDLQFNIISTAQATDEIAPSLSAAEKKAAAAAAKAAALRKAKEAAAIKAAAKAAAKAKAAAAKAAALKRAKEAAAIKAADIKKAKAIAAAAKAAAAKIAAEKAAAAAKAAAAKIAAEKAAAEAKLAAKKAEAEAKLAAEKAEAEAKIAAAEQAAADQEAADKAAEQAAADQEAADKAAAEAKLEESEKENAFYKKAFNYDLKKLSAIEEVKKYLSELSDDITKQRELYENGDDDEFRYLTVLGAINHVEELMNNYGQSNVNQDDAAGLKSKTRLSSGVRLQQANTDTLQEANSEIEEKSQTLQDADEAQNVLNLFR